MIRFGSVCSGIEAASVAWHPLGWKAAWLSEIEPFPSAVLAHHYPDVPNLGDMTTLPERIMSGEIECPDIFCGGTPCQAFSVAGLRKSLDDARGNLSLTFCEIANAIDDVRHARGELPAVIFWENVPGVLSTKDNAFGCFLAGLAGEELPLLPAGGKWTNAGCVFGPQRAVAWRVLDAQYFGVAQRRRRVFVVASARNDFDPAAVLFEFDGVRRDTAPSREAGKETAKFLTTGVGQRYDPETESLIPSYGIPGNWIGRKPENGGNAVEPMHDIAPCLTKTDRHGVAQPMPIITMAHGQGGAEIGFDRGPTLTCNHEAPIAAYAIQAGALRTNPNSGPDGVGVQADHAYTLEARAEVQAVAFAENSRHEIRLEGGDGSRTGTLSTGGGKPGQGTPMVAVTFQERGRTDGRSLEVGGDVAYALTAPNGGGRAQERNVLTPTMQVRRLTPVECERLQGFTDDYTQIPWRKKPASDCPDGPRYKALGNSWAVPNVRWIGKRIDAHLHALSGAINEPSGDIL